MTRYRIYIIFSLVVGVGLLAILLVSWGYYPVATVNGDFISARQLSHEFGAASLYYKNLLQTYRPALKDAEQLSASDLQLAVLNSLIEKSLISKAVRQETGEDFAYLLENKLSRFLGDEELEIAAANLYGLSGEEFRGDVLVPQAEREILAGRLFLRGEEIEDWILKAKAAARVTLFSPNFEWTGEAVTSRGQ